MSGPTMHVTVTNVTVKLTIVVISITIIVNFGRRIYSGIVNVNSSVIISDVRKTRLCRVGPIMTGSDLLSIVQGVPRIDRIRHCTAGPNVVVATSGFRKVVIGKITRRCS